MIWPHPICSSSIRNGEPPMSEKEQPLLSLCMIVKDEEQWLEACLQSVHQTVDEMIVVDTGSKDATTDIALRYGAKVYHHFWKNDFAEARNRALELAKGQWILHLDADEQLASAAISRLPDILSHTDADGILAQVRNWHPRDDMVRYLDSPQVRLFRNLPTIRYEGRVHEQIAPSIQRCNGKIENSDLLIHHYGYQQNNRSKARRNLAILEEQTRKHPEDLFTRYKLAETCKALGDNERARNIFKEIADNEINKLNSDMAENLYMRLAQLELAENHFENTIRYAEKSLGMNGENSLSEYLLSIACIYTGQGERAMNHLQHILQENRQDVIDRQDVEKLISVCRHTMESL